ncbi:MAG: type II toxin-antitoxin system Phd/YefM family antitoxin [Melioribacteraceae bacterium]|nr:type II toxin-antitoxin system Phd/YefM family antitoxin [Melioribacteraceae bacterium]
MQTTTFTDARNNLNRLITSIDENNEPIVILGTKGRQDSVLISKENYDNLIENLYILSDSNWVKSIKKGVKEIESAKGVKMDLYTALGI